MKTRTLNKAYCLLLIAGLTLTNVSPALANLDNGSKPVKTNKDSITIKKNSCSSKYKINIYPNASHKVLFFSASGAEGRVYQLLLFNCDGRLIKQSQVRNRETTVLSQLEKGSYQFSVMSNDEKIEDGLITVH